VEQALELYRRNYRPSARYPKPQATICVWALAADTEAEARHLATSREHSRILRDVGIREAIVTPEEAAAYPYSAAQRASIEAMRRKAFVGSAEQVATRLAELARGLELDELVIVTWTYDPAARHRSYELLAAAVPQAPQ
jgi:alkanesulfonate monooxygenase SsuD/methylene tetrahydromethanopterin reductase-like flavin-dependent oxidoreductase (luciferase family)